MLIDLIFIILEWLIQLFERLFWTKERIGAYGEELTARIFRRLNRRRMHGTLLKNLYLQKDDGTTTEIDLIYITRKGIFVIESKNYSGWIFGDAYEQYWMQSLPNRQKTRFYNPIRQNFNHIKWLRAKIGEDVPIFSVIVFSERCTLKKVAFDPEQVLVVKRERLFRAVRQMWKQLPDILSEQQTAELCSCLEPLTHVDKSIKQEHVEAIRENMQNATICPRCGAQLVLRTAKQGTNAGKQFYGCTAFPKCRYIRQL